MDSGGVYKSTANLFSRWKIEDASARIWRHVRKSGGSEWLKLLIAMRLSRTRACR